MLKQLQSLCLILMLSAVCSTASAQWKSDSVSNTLVIRAASNQQQPKACTDGADGAIIVWEDYRYNGGWDLFAQRINADGKKVWADTGVVICKATGEQRYHAIASDGSGGAYIVWEDRRTATLGSEIFAQHIDADGKLSYAVNGARLDSALRDQEIISITADGNGGAFVAWEDSRSTTSVTRPDIYMNHLSKTAVDWGKAGKAIITQTNQQHHPRIVEDGQGGCVIVYETTQGVPPSIWAARINANGDHLWGTQGMTVYRGANIDMIARNASITRDGNKFLIAWEVTSAGSSGQDIYATKINLDSTKDWFSPAEVTGEWAGDQVNPQIFSDDSNGAIVVFEDFSSDAAPNYYNYDVAAVRVFPNGVDRFPKFENGFSYVVRQTRGQRFPQTVKSDNGGFIAVWNDARASATDTSIYAQRMDRSLKRQFFPAGASQSSTWGQPISVATGLQHHVVLVPRTNGAIAIWADTRAGSNDHDIYAQLIFKNGTLPIELASFTAKANDAGQVMLDWKTANEIDNAGFEVERRLLDGGSNDFQVVASYQSNASLRGAGNSSTPKSYSFVDEPAAGIYEYRIADVGLDGARTAHNVRRVEVSTTSNRSWSVGNLFPNPATGHDLRLPIMAAEKASVTITVRNMIGQVVYEQSASVSAGSSSIVLSLPQLSNGAYVYQMSAKSEDGALLWVSPVGNLRMQR